MTDREKLIDAMARARDAVIFGKGCPIYPEDLEAMRAAFDTLSKAIPGLSDVLAGKAVIVPMGMTPAMLKAATKSLGVEYDGTIESRVRLTTVIMAYDDLLAASPYRSKTDEA